MKRDVTSSDPSTEPSWAWDVPAASGSAWVAQVLGRASGAAPGALDGVTAALAEDDAAVPPDVSPFAQSMGTVRVVTAYRGDGASSCFVLKTESPVADNNKAAALFRLFHREASFYKYFAPKCRARVPRCYYASVSPTGVHTTLLLELVPGKCGAHSEVEQNSESAGRLADSGIVASLSVHNIRAAAVELAYLHASALGQEEKCAKLVSASEHMAYFNAKAGLDLVMARWEPMFAEFSVADSGDTADPARLLREVFEHCAALDSNWALLLGVGQPSVVHGDLKPANVIISKSADNSPVATLIDFQTTYRGGDIARADDLAQLLIAGMDENMRAAYEDVVLSLYLDTLTAAAEEGEPRDRLPSPEEFRHYYKMAIQGMVYRCLLYNLALANAPAEEWTRQLDTLMRRTCAAILDHNLHSVLAVGKK